MKKALKIFSKFVLPWKNLSKRNQRILTGIALAIILICLPISIYILRHAGEAQAAWFNTNWSFRKSIAITTHSAAENNVYINLASSNALDTSDSTRFQADCGDLRFTDQNGKQLPYYIVSGCGSSSTVIHVFFKAFPAGAQTIYFYYGNPQAPNGFSASDFSTEASSYSIGSQGSEEAGAAPVAYYKFDEGTGTSVKDGGTNNINGTVTGATWKSASDCISGSCLYFNGFNVGNKVDLGTSAKLNPTSFTVSTWIKTPDSTLTYNYIFSDDRDCCGTYNGIGFYINSSSKLIGNIWNSTNNSVTSNQSISPNKWYYVTFSYDGSNMKLYINGILDKTTAYGGGVGSPASFNASVGTMGNGQGTYTFKGYIDEFKLYSYPRTASQIKADFNSRGSKTVGANVLGTSIANQNLTNGLVGYWKMDESSWNGTSGEVIDSSGNGNNGTSASSATTAAGKFGNGGNFTSSGQQVNVVNSTSLNITGPITLSGWIYITACSGQYTILFWKNLQYTVAASNCALTWADSSNWSYGNFGSYGSLGINAWHHIVATKDANNIVTIYLDGQSVVSKSFGSAITGTTNSLGIADSGNGVLTGKMDEVRVYNRALSPAEVTQLYNFAPGPLAYYNFEEGSGTSLNDLSGNGNSGSWAGTGPYYAQGKYGKGGNFNGTDSYARATHSIMTAADSTISFWLKIPVQSASYHRILSDSTNGIEMYFTGTGTNGLYGTIGNGTSGWIMQSPNLADGNWHYVSLVSTASDGYIRAYLDGVLKSSTNATYSSITLDDLYIGRSYSTPYYLQGGLDELKIYNYARTPGQVVSDMNAAHPLGGSPIGSQVAYWKFDEGYGTSTANNSGNAGSADNLTITGATWNNNGKFGKALNFNGSSNYLSRSSAAGDSLDPLNGITLSAWINPSVAQTGVIMSRNGPYLFNFNSNGTISLWILGGGSYDNTSTTDTVPLGTWSYVAATYDGTTMKIYINGRLSKSKVHSTTGTLEQSARTFWIGYGNAGDQNYFAGKIDEAKVYGDALTASEIKLDYNHGASEVLGATSDTSGLTGGQVASNSASAAYCIPGDTSTCSAPVADWEFEEGSGTSLNDLSGNGNTGTLTGTTLPKWAAGKYGQALSFDGNSSYVRIPSGFTNTIAGSNNHTLSFWFKANSFGQKVILGGDLSTYYIQFNGATGMYVQVGAVYRTYTLLSSLAIGQWYQVTFVKTGAGDLGNLYVDGILQTSYTGTIASTPSTAADFLIGKYTSAGYEFSGLIDNVRIYNYSRTPAQVAWDYNRGAPVGWWKFDECQGTTANDSSGNGNSGTLTVGGSGTQTAIGTCSTASTAWGNGATGKYNASLKFDATDDNVTANVNGLSNKYVSVSAWIKANSFFNYNNFVNHNWVGNGWILFAVNTNQIYFGVGQSGTQYSTPTNTLSTGTWYYITGVYDGSNVKIYVNGQFVSQTSLSNATLDNAASNVIIGSAGDSQIDDVRVYNYALTKQQIQMIFNQGSAVRFGPQTGAP